MIRIGGMTPLTSIDFPDRLAAVLFLQGCPWRCGYCHNPELLPARGEGGIAWEAVGAFLRRRRGLLDGVVFSGGEPTAQAALPAAMAEVKALSYQLALHTGGMYPARLQRVLPLLDWVGLDIKAPAGGYDRVTGCRRSGVPVGESLQLLLDSGVAYECRTTWNPRVFPLDDLYRLADELAGRGVRHWVLQECSSQGQGIAVAERPDLARLGRDFEQFQFRHG
ncbi:anaerobic ribonucleoside-triphosphate reductase activating protein [Flavobacterium sp. MXW15]|uniref:Anaerobic ribonucleoside-triphosphate reductase activating protein n=1 Tax=Xanthomonas chitinilytica TaxID=2989819 RepID=A0ABT3JWG5_9XANT|nr:anaerobic ribonucleoside-triphosphate reductase activating protein [Xanthomonas sp. H13-6]MCW4455021.1 anaerobic ribonucleoside-triphosphate reductase activating protein [Flavobacterium sp. MXW15]MCW4472813.1 anaerobic ribonucleoside-triphosphate reductase activating protein [Xanthomonas sp. H13-6]